MIKDNGKIRADIRERLQLLDPLAILTKEELAELLATTPAAVGQMQYQKELPVTAFPGKRRACWFVRDVRAWLQVQSAQRDRSQQMQSPQILESRSAGGQSSIAD